MNLISNDFRNGSRIPSLFTCDSRNLSPHLAWDGVPPGTWSLALIVDDPDAPVGTWIHWLVCDIDPGITEIPRDTVPADARQVNNDFGKPGYGGPCPPSGVHRYFFKLHALDIPTLGRVNSKSFRGEVERHTIEDAVLMGIYSRNR